MVAYHYEFSCKLVLLLVTLVALTIDHMPGSSLKDTPETVRDTQSSPGTLIVFKDIQRHPETPEQPRVPNILWENRNYLEQPGFLQDQTPFS